MRLRRMPACWLYGLLSAALFAGPMDAADAAAPAKRRPNIVFIMADDKYDSGQPKVENTRKNRTKRPFFESFQITGNCGEFRQITGN